MGTCPEPQLPATLNLSRLESVAQPEEGEALVERLAEEMSRRWHQGECPPAEEFLKRHPELEKQPEVAVELLLEEVGLRQEKGEETAALDVARRFPHWARPLEVLIACQQLLEARPEHGRFAGVGDMLGDFRLVAELGRGVQGPVFLAVQSALGDRPVVVKLIGSDGQEHLSLARLQHTHIVPLYSVQDFPDRRQHALCMPYFGGTTLAHLLEAVRAIPPGLRTGKHLLHALQQTPGTGPIAVPIGGPACRFLSQASYIQAVCWMGACLADALHYAHERGLVHLDIKPANVLLAADGQPMLLDFHLARSALQAGTTAPERLGGTPAYMAPEQRAALREVPGSGLIMETVDGRADIYSLGALLYEALGGVVPVPADRPGRELRRRNSKVSVGLADLLNRCLTPNLNDRYPDAAILASDLRRHSADLPLRGVRNRSLVERWRKWRRRRPVVVILVASFLAVLIAVGLVVVQGNRQLYQARLALVEGREHLTHHRLRDAVSAFQRGLALTEAVPLSRELARELRENLRLAEGGKLAQQLHELVDGLRPYFGVAPLPSAEVSRVEPTCRQFWEKRHLIYERLAPQHDPELTRQMQTDLLDLAILWTELRVRLAGDQEMAARHEALKVLDQAEQLFGRHCVLDQERRNHGEALGLPTSAETACMPRSAWEHGALGRALLRAGQLESAAFHFQQALEQEPGDLWTNFASGVCAYRQGRWEDALIAFQSCVALAPDRAWCFYNRGLAYQELGRQDRAQQDFQTARRLDPSLATAHPDQIR
jgi:serine/threonine protein kinase